MHYLPFFKLFIIEKNFKSNVRLLLEIRENVPDCWLKLPQLILFCNINAKKKNSYGHI